MSDPTRSDPDSYKADQALAPPMPDPEPADEPIQDLLDHENPCFGCGPDNPEGLQIKSYPDPDGDGLVAAFTSSPHHSGSGGVLGGGIQATLVDCHGVWTAVYHAALEGRDPVPHYVTAELHMEYRAPAPLAAPVELTSTVAEVQGRRVHVDVELADEGDRACTRGRVVCHALDEGWAPNPYLG